MWSCELAPELPQDDGIAARCAARPRGDGATPAARLPILGLDGSRAIRNVLRAALGARRARADALEVSNLGDREARACWCCASGELDEEHRRARRGRSCRCR
jgi:hypothetical protein